VIQTSTGSDVEDLLSRVAARPERYAEVVVCSPFVDAEMLDRFISLVDVTRGRSCGVRLITSEDTARTLRPHLPGHPSFWKSLVASQRRLHAKVYLALARRRFVSEAIVTSANLTRAAVSENIELGVRALSTTDAGRRLLDQVHYFVRRIPV